MKLKQLYSKLKQAPGSDHVVAEMMKTQSELKSVIRFVHKINGSKTAQDRYFFLYIKKL